MVKKFNRGISTLMTIGIILVLVVVVGGFTVQQYLETGKKEQAKTELQEETEVQIGKESKLVSFEIVPSCERGDLWIVYQKGAKAIAKGENLSKVEFWVSPTGTGMEDYLFERNELIRNGNQWEMLLPDMMFVGDFYVIGYDSEGKQVGKISLGTVSGFVGYPEDCKWKTYRNEEYGYEIKYPESFATSTTDCYTFTTEGKLKDEKALRFYWEEKGMHILICRVNVWYKNLSWIKGEAIEIDGHDGFVDKFTIRGGGRAYYFVDQNNENSIFMDSFWAYPEGSIEDSDLKPKEEIIDKIISNFKFIESKDEIEDVEEGETDEEEISEPVCQDECSQTGLKDCFNNGYKICGNFDADDCLEWSSTFHCSSERICRDGNCIFEKNTLLLVVEQSLYGGLIGELNTYSDDVKRELDFTTIIKTFPSSANVSEIKSYIGQIYNSNKLSGVLLIGNLPSEENLDCVYQEVDGLDCRAHKHSFWISRLTPNSSSKDSLSLLKDYFRRNHEYRTGGYDYKDKILIYTPLLLDGYSLERREQVKFAEKTSLELFDMYSDDDYHFIDIEKENSDQLYLTEIKKPYEYEIVHYEGHGTQTSHEKNIFSNDVKNTSFFFGEFTSCSGGDFTTKDYIAGNYLFEGKGLLLNAFTKIGMGAVGQVNSNNYYLLSIGEPFFEVGGANFGDLTLRMRYFDKPSSHGFDDPIIEVDKQHINLTESSPFVKITIKNLGRSRLKFVVNPRCFTELGMMLPLGGLASLNTGPNHFFLEGNEEGTYEVRWELTGVGGEPPKREGSCRGDLYILSNDPINPYISIPLEVGGL